MARRQRHGGNVGRVPGRDDQPPRIGRALDVGDHLRDLVDDSPVRRRPRPPLLAVHRAEIAIDVRPFVPDADAVALQVGDVGVARQEPQQLVQDRLHVQLLGRHQRKAIGEVEAHLMAEHAQRACARAVGFAHALGAHVAEEVEVGLHDFH